MENIKKTVLIIIFALIAILIQGTVLSNFFPSAPLPNLLIGLLVFVVFSETTVLGVFLAFLLGLLLDVFSSQLLGPWAGSYVLVFFLFSLFMQRVYVGSGLIIMLAGGIASLLASVLYLFITAPYSERSFNVGFVIIYEAVLSAVLAPLVYRAVSFLYPKSQGPHSRYGTSF